MENINLAQFEGAVYDETKVDEYLERYADDLVNVADEEKETYAKAFEQIMIELANNSNDYAKCEKIEYLIFDVYKRCGDKGDVKDFMAKAKRAWLPKFMMLPFKQKGDVMNDFAVNTIVRKMNITKSHNKLFGVKKD